MGDNNHSVFIADNFEGINSQFTNFTLYRTTSLNRLVKAQRYGQWWLLKCLREEVEYQPVYQEMLRKEFEVIIQMQHPNIVRAYGMELVEPYGMCIVMEWVEGETLDEFLSKQDDRQTRINILREIVAALGYLHQKDVIHQDLKPANILITSTGSSVRLIDFGLADTSSFAVLKKSGGTRRYASPEQINGDSPDMRNDIYSFGVMLKEMHMGKKFDKIAERCMEPIDKRYQYVAELSKALELAAGEKKKYQKNKWLIILTMVSLTFACVAGYSLYQLNGIKNENKSDVPPSENPEYMPTDLVHGEEPTLKIVNPDLYDKCAGWSHSANSNLNMYDDGNISIASFYCQTFDFWQVVHGLEPGEYELSVHGFHQPKTPEWTKHFYNVAKDKENGTLFSSAWLYAGTDSIRLLNWASECCTEPIPDDPLYKEEVVPDLIPMALPASSYYFTHGHYLNKLKFKLVDSDSVKIGIRCPIMMEEALSWVVFDTFRLRKL